MFFKKVLSAGDSENAINDVRPHCIIALHNTVKALKIEFDKFAVIACNDKSDWETPIPSTSAMFFNRFRIDNTPSDMKLFGLLRTMISGSFPMWNNHYAHRYAPADSNAPVANHPDGERQSNHQGMTTHFYQVFILLARNKQAQPNPLRMKHKLHPIIQTLKIIKIAISILNNVCFNFIRLKWCSLSKISVFRFSVCTVCFQNNHHNTAIIIALFATENSNVFPAIIMAPVKRVTR